MLLSYDDIIKRIADGYSALETIYGFQASVSVTTSANNMPMNYSGLVRAMRSSLPSGVTSFIPVSMEVANSTNNMAMLAVRLVDMGNLTLATPTFTDGSTMGTRTELGVAGVNVFSPVLARVTTALNATPGSLTLQYVDQSGNSAENAPSLTLPASAPINTMFWVPLNTGDVGARDVSTGTTRTGGTTPTGTINFYGVELIGLFGVSQSFTGPGIENLITRSLNIANLGINDQIHFICLGSTAQKSILGSVLFVGDN